MPATRFDLFSKRRERALQEQPDVFEYEHISDKFRNQVVFLIKRTVLDGMDDPYADTGNQFYGEVNLGCVCKLD